MWINLREKVNFDAKNKFKSLIYEYQICSNENNNIHREKNLLEKISGFAKAMDITNPLTELNLREITDQLYPSDDCILDLLRNYNKYLTRPEEKLFLEKIRLCGMKHQIINQEEGMQIFLKRMHELQKNSPVILFLM